MNDSASAFRLSYDLDFSIWSVIKHCIGKDLTRISMPVVLNEPISFLQRLAECMEYSDLLHKALEQTDSIKRIEYVCAFALSALSSNFNRTNKPFNPLLGETYEFHLNDYIFVAEQVSHHPPISAFHVESTEYSLHSTVQFKLRFWGQSIDVQPKGHMTLKLHKFKEIYTWPHPHLVLHNILTGKLWVEYVGNIDITSHTSPPITSRIEFKSSGPNMHEVYGHIFHERSFGKPPVRVLFGDLTKGLFSVDPDIWVRRGSSTKSTNEGPPKQDCEFGFVHALPEQCCLWLPNPHHPNVLCDYYYNFTEFTCALNDLCPDLADARFSPPNLGSAAKLLGGAFLPPTDSRYRPDIRALELGDLNLAASEKDRLEEKQRSVRRSTSSPQSNLSNMSLKFRRSHSTLSSSAHTLSTRHSIVGPIWFKRGLNKATNEEEWLFNGNYWLRNWKLSPDLY